MPLGPKGDPGPVGMLLMISGPNQEGRDGGPVGARSAGQGRGGRVGSRPEPGPCRAGEAEECVCMCVRVCVCVFRLGPEPSKAGEAERTLCVCV